MFTPFFPQNCFNPFINNSNPFNGFNPMGFNTCGPTTPWTGSTNPWTCTSTPTPWNTPFPTTNGWTNSWNSVPFNGNCGPFGWTAPFTGPTMPGTFNSFGVPNQFCGPMPTGTPTPSFFGFNPFLNGCTTPGPQPGFTPGFNPMNSFNPFCHWTNPFGFSPTPSSAWSNFHPFGNHPGTDADGGTNGAFNHYRQAA
jgi:hypothetical protein